MPETNVVSQKTGWVRAVGLAAAGVGVLAVAGWLALRPAPPTTQAAPAAAAALPAKLAAAPGPVAAPVPAPAAVAAPAVIAPSFDIVRVAPGGNTVVAGRAEPNAEVSLRENGREIGRTQADALGQWVILPAGKLASGGQELTLSARGSSGAERAGDTPVVVLVPEPARAGQPPAPPVQVLATPRAEAPRLLQAPAPANARLSLNVVDYDDRGEIRFAGIAPPGTALRVYVDNRPVGEARADAEGRWALQPDAAVPSGDHRLRVDQVAPAGQVAARIELPFQRSPIAAAELPAGRVVVQPRQNLWRMARTAYGQGVRYTVIYAANRDQIRDPNRIYPGQLIAIPAGLDAPAEASDTAGAPRPSSSSRSR